MACPQLVTLQLAFCSSRHSPPCGGDASFISIARDLCCIEANRFFCATTDHAA
ncbi:hypothetical protein PF005_g21217 [Phytophthora fragariae]|uniref:Uncharacterized protein n=1 Tax=Phytophthora fragariae TaxID=53985 RepID=A0A6A3XE79_9STRA|nr:hypothetical protein PF009_g22220 [Phytophthora fragariae]KAE9085627.1 hypothetical protein PF007_g21071 [Phytophthora fragariae]KAE9112217.1 hypothetical protein PF006_g20025 [Phytophthora fragariae]KAE9185517.1 hypothetical protein PF005_g21217 [Phytophthora fragariae]KAE9196851.1 hypothetical protein PF004_g20013 [Phytophthora fragariae]